MLRLEIILFLINNENGTMFSKTMICLFIYLSSAFPGVVVTARTGALPGSASSRPGGDAGCGSVTDLHVRGEDILDAKEPGGVVGAE